MRFLLRAALLGLAAFGAKALVDRFRPQVEALNARASQAIREKVEPAVQDAVQSVAATSKSAASDLADATKQAISDVRDDIVEPAATPTAESAASV